MSGTSSPPAKRLKLESSSPSPRGARKPNPEDFDQDHCSICLQQIIDCTVIPTCSHEFCFECLIIWSGQSRRCPLCSQAIGEYVIHYIRSKYDFKKHYLAPLRTSSPPLQAHARATARENVRRRTEREWGRRQRREREEADELDRAIAKRRWIYEHNLYAKHVASNSYTRYRPYPTPAQFAASPELIARTTTFLRRELRVWIHLDVEFLTSFILSLMKSIDIRSESAVKLLSEFLDMDAEGLSTYVEGERSVNAEHFAHEVYSYLRSPYRDLFVYDSVVQYDPPPNIPPPAEYERSRRWRPRSASRSRSRSWSRVRSRSRSVSRSRLRISRRNHLSRSRSRSLSCPRNEERVTSDADHRRLSRSHSRSRSRKREQCFSRSRYLSRGRGSSVGGRVKPSEPLDIEKGRAEAHQDPMGKCGASTGSEHKMEEKSRGDSRADTPVGQEMDVDTAEPPTLSSTAPPQPPTRLPRSRNRTLLESVQSHLKGQPKALHRTRVITSPENAGAEAPSNPVHPVPETDPPPSLLARLSDPDHTPALGVKQSTIISSDLRVTPPTMMKPLADQGKEGVAMSAPEIMARTRARLAKLKNASTSDEMDTNADNNTNEKPPSISASKNGSLSSSMRFKLLTRLEEEKQQVHHLPDPEELVSSPAPMAASSSRSEIKLEIPSSALTPADTDFPVARLEAKLRMRAQLRVRLAAAKRGGSGVRNSSVEDVA